MCAGGEMGKQGGVVEQDASASARGREIERVAGGSGMHREGLGLRTAGKPRNG